MTINELFDKQKELDDYILTELRKRTGEDIKQIDVINEETVALYVELGEFLEEKDKNRKLFEYVDILHFLLSIGNAFKIKFEEDTKFEAEYNDTKTNDMSFGKFVAAELFIQHFSKFINYCAEFKYWKTNKTINKKEQLVLYVDSFISFMYMGNAFGYTSEEILNAYIEKHQENKDRQVRGY